MPIETTPISGLLLYTPRVFPDERGYFFESWNARTFGAFGVSPDFVQDNEAASQRGVLRGLHYQQGADAQAKLVRVISGEVYDVAVDLRPGSPTLHRWYGTYLSGDNRRQLYIPRGFAHGYLVTSERAVFAYKCDNYYAPGSEGGRRYDDPVFGIEWPEVAGGYVIAQRDLAW